MIVGDPPGDVAREFRFPEPLGALSQGFPMEARIGESKYGFQAAPQRQRTRDIRVQLLRQEARADQLSPAVPSCFWIEMGAVDETFAPLGDLVGSRDPIDEAF